MLEGDGERHSHVAPAIFVDLGNGKQVSIFAAALPEQVTAASKTMRWRAGVDRDGRHRYDRKSMQGLAVMVHQGLKRNPHGGDRLVFRGSTGSLVKIIWHYGNGMSLYAKRLEKGRFVWPSAKDGMVS